MAIRVPGSRKYIWNNGLLGLGYKVFGFRLRRAYPEGVVHHGQVRILEFGEKGLGAYEVEGCKVSIRGFKFSISDLTHNPKALNRVAGILSDMVWTTV